MKSFYIGNLEIKLPLIQGGMGVGISLSGLASAVANEGGVGVISCAGLGLLYPELSTDYLKNSILGLREELRKAKEKTQGVIGVNIMVALSNFSDMGGRPSQRKPILFFQEQDSRWTYLPILITKVRQNWYPSYLHHELPDSFVKSGNTIIIICPMRLS